MTEHSFNTQDAQKYGIEKAILLKNLRFWLDKEKANAERTQNFTEDIPKIREHEGIKYVWTYNSSRAFAELFPYMSERSIGRWLKELEDDGVIICSMFNKNNYDKTKWFTMPEYIIEEQKEQSVRQNGESISQNGESISQNGEPIPDINTNINTYILDEHIFSKICLATNIKPEETLNKQKTEINNLIVELKTIYPNHTQEQLTELIQQKVQQYRIQFTTPLTVKALHNNWNNLIVEKKKTVKHKHDQYRPDIPIPDKGTEEYASYEYLWQLNVQTALATDLQQRENSRIKAQQLLEQLKVRKHG